MIRLMHKFCCSLMKLKVTKTLRTSEKALILLTRSTDMKHKLYRAPKQRSGLSGSDRVCSDLGIICMHSRAPPITAGRRWSASAIIFLVVFLSSIVAAGGGGGDTRDRACANNAPFPVADSTRRALCQFVSRLRTVADQKQIERCRVAVACQS